MNYIKMNKTVTEELPFYHYFMIDVGKRDDRILFLTLHNDIVYIQKD